MAQDRAESPIRWVLVSTRPRDTPSIIKVFWNEAEPEIITHDLHLLGGAFHHTITPLATIWEYQEQFYVRFMHDTGSQELPLFEKDEIFSGEKQAIWYIFQTYANTSFGKRLYAEAIWYDATTDQVGRIGLDSFFQLEWV